VPRRCTLQQPSGSRFGLATLQHLHTHTCTGQSTSPATLSTHSHSHMCRANLSYASVSMAEDLHFSPVDYGLGSGECVFAWSAHCTGLLLTPCTMFERPAQPSSS
jgi:hypothetical protein